MLHAYAAPPVNIQGKYAGLRAKSDHFSSHLPDPARHLQTTGWRHLLERYIHYRTVQSDGSVSTTDAEVIDLDGMTHVAGMVGSGKSTLMKIITTHAHFSHWRVTLVV
jgi:hypothetical protein